MGQRHKKSEPHSGAAARNTHTLIYPYRTLTPRVDTPVGVIRKRNDDAFSLSNLCRLAGLASLEVRWQPFAVSEKFDVSARFVHPERLHRPLLGGQAAETDPRQKS